MLQFSMRRVHIKSIRSNIDTRALTECIANVCEKPCDSCCILRDGFVNTEINVKSSTFQVKKTHFKISNELSREQLSFLRT